MKQYVVLLALFVATVFFSFAEETAPTANPEGPRPPHREMIKKKLEHLRRELNLSPDQIEKIKAVFEQERQEIKPILEDQSLEKEQKHQEIKAIREKYEPQIKAILTPEQQAKFEKMKAEHKERWEKKQKPAADASTNPAPANP